jgi:hypothetical protein
MGDKKRKMSRNGGKRKPKNRIRKEMEITNDSPRKTRTHFFYLMASMSHLKIRLDENLGWEEILPI